MRKTVQELGLIESYRYYERGKNNGITDVPGVKVGHTTIIEGDDVRTGVTAVIPEGFDKHCYVGNSFTFNGNGEVTGLHYLEEEGRLVSPIFLTNTISIGDVFSAAVDYYKGKVALPIVGECWDGWLSDIWGRHVKAEHVVKAIETAAGGKVPQGSVGAGTGMNSFGFKAGIGTASRKFALDGKEYTIGILTNNNMGNKDDSHRYLRIAGVEVNGEMEHQDKPIKQETAGTHDSSSICVIATDAPLSFIQLGRLAKHAVLGFARIGLVSYTGSGDFMIAFSMANRLPSRETTAKYTTEAIGEYGLDVVFEALLESVEEAYLNSLFMAEDMTGRDGHVMEALPVEKLFKSN